jgi:hypothetical protein
MKSRNWNLLTLQIFAPVLIAAGILGFITPPSLALMSGAAPYNIFHLIFGTLGLALVLTKQYKLIVLFNIGFGALDLYQAIASFAGLFPKSLFLWKTADDILHIVLGAALVAIGVLLDRQPTAAADTAAPR